MQKIRLTFLVIIVFITLFIMKFNASNPKTLNGTSACVRVDDAEKFTAATGEPVAEVMHRLSLSEAVKHTEAFGADLAALVNWGTHNTPTPEGSRLPPKDAIIDTILRGYRQQCVKAPRWLTGLLEELQIEEQ